jgi:hypothetical protein
VRACACGRARACVFAAPSGVSCAATASVTRSGRCPPSRPRPRTSTPVRPPFAGGISAGIATGVEDAVLIGVLADSRDHGLKVTESKVP